MQGASVLITKVQCVGLFKLENKSEGWYLFYLCVPVLLCSCKGLTGSGIGWKDRKVLASGGLCVQGDTIQEAAPSWALLARAGTEMARRRWERAIGPRDCVKSHGAYVRFIATQDGWGGQKQEPACKEMLCRRSCI